jgi:hypothetical protein
MSLDQLTAFFKWMTVINLAVLVVSLLLSIALKDTVRKMHGRLFGVDEDMVSVVGYGYLGAYRIFVLVFNVVPYVSLLIVT